MVAIVLEEMFPVAMGAMLEEMFPVAMGAMLEEMFPVAMGAMLEPMMPVVMQPAVLQLIVVHRSHHQILVLKATLPKAL